MSAPAFSTFSAISELFVTAAVFYVIFADLKGRPFQWKLAFTVIGFEFLVNMMYMIIRMKEHTETNLDSGFVAFAAGHGFLSLLVFILFVIFSFLAYSASKKEKNFFRENLGMTYAFIVLWSISVVSGEILYFVNYA